MLARHAHPFAHNQTLLSRLIFWQPHFKRRHRRFHCCIVATMHLAERHMDCDGVILELSQGGLLFRPASLYIMERPLEPVAVRFEGRVLKGVIRNVSAQGYGIQFDADISEDQVQSLIKTYGLESLNDPKKRHAAEASLPRNDFSTPST